MNDSFGTARRAGGVHEGDRIFGARAPALTGRRRGLHDLGHARQAGALALASQPDVAQGSKGRIARRDRLGYDVPPPTVDNQHLRFGMMDEVFDFRQFGLRDDGHEDGLRARHTVIGHDVVEIVLHEHRDPLAGADAMCTQRIRETRGAFVELAVAEMRAVFTEYDCNAISAKRRGTFENGIGGPDHGQVSCSPKYARVWQSARGAQYSPSGGGQSVR